MIKARSGDTLIFGLSARNIELLLDGKPIAFDLDQLGQKGRIVIFYGKTEEEMQKDLEAAVSKLPALT